MSLVNYIFNVSKTIAMTWISVTLKKQVEFIAHMNRRPNSCSIGVWFHGLSLRFTLRHKKPKDTISPSLTDIS